MSFEGAGLFLCLRFLCQDVCHVLREHQLFDRYIGPRNLVYTAALEMHPLETEHRLEDLNSNFRDEPRCLPVDLPAGLDQPRKRLLA